MNIMALFNALPGACAQGLIWGIMAIGVYITYKILDVADLTVDGTMCTGGAVCVMMMLNGYSIWISLLCAFIGGYAGRTYHGHIPYVHGNTRDTGRYTDPACAVFDQPAHTGLG